MKEKPTYKELMDHNRQLEEKISLLEGTMKQFQSDGTRVKTRFLSNISHEIRTPMNAIIGFSHLLGEEDVNNNQREEYIDHITRNSNSLLIVLDNLIDLTLYETDNLKLKKEEVLIYSLIKELFDKYNQERLKVNKDKVTLLLNVHDSLKSVRIITDGHRLSRVLSCLIGNAIAIKNKGVVEIGAALIDKNHIVFSVKEDGSKLILERAKKVFENNDSEEDLVNGSDAIGLGYKLARGIVEKMGGEIRLEDNALNGSTIGFVLPVDVVKQTVKMEKDSKSARSLQA
jgi:K+-sensing histidine kinase KdpD